MYKLKSILLFMITLFTITTLSANNPTIVFMKVWEGITETKIYSHIVPYSNHSSNLSYKWKRWENVYSEYAYFDKLKVDYVITDTWGLYNERIYSISLDSFSHTLGTVYSDSFIIKLKLNNNLTTLDSHQMILISKWHIPFTLIDTLEYTSLLSFITDLYVDSSGYINNIWTQPTSNIEYSPISLAHIYSSNNLDYIEFFTYAKIGDVLFFNFVSKENTLLYTDQISSTPDIFASIIKFHKLYSSTNPYNTNHTFRYVIPTQDELVVYHIIYIYSSTGAGSTILNLYYKLNCRGEYTTAFGGLKGTELILRNSSIQLHLISKNLIDVDTVSYLSWGNTSNHPTIYDTIIDTIFH